MRNELSHVATRFAGTFVTGTFVSIDPADRFVMWSQAKCPD